MGIFSKAKEKNELVLVFDIGSSSVGGALFYVQGSGVPKIISSIREPILLEKKFNIDRFLYSTIKSLNIVTNKICLMGLGAPARIFCVLSSPWYASQTRTIKLKKNTFFIFNSKLADSLIQKEISLFEEEHLAKYKNMGQEVRVIEFKTIKTVLNGYATLKPIGQKAKQLEMTIFISITPEQILGKIEETIHRHFHSGKIQFSSFVIASFTTVCSIFTEQKDFLLIDISGEVTDVSMIQEDMLRESVSFPMGQNFIIRGVALSLNSTLDEVKSFISLYKDGHAEESARKKLEGILSKLKIEWLKKFQESLASLSNSISIPATIFVTVDQDLADFFSETIKAEQFSQYTLTKSKFQIIFLNNQALHGMAVFKENINRDPFLIIGSVYINRFLC